MVDLIDCLIRRKSTVLDCRMRAACKPGNPSGIVELMNQLVMSGRQKRNNAVGFRKSVTPCKLLETGQKAPIHQH
jgi:hypothetical protein